MKRKRTSILPAVTTLFLAALVLLAAVVPRQEANGQNPVPTPTGTPAPAQEVHVEIKNFAFNPASITIRVGTMVIWTNKDSVQHTVTATSASGAFDSGVLDKNQTFSMVFDNIGTYSYFCSIHPYMKGKVTVGLQAGGVGAAPLRIFGQPVYILLGMLSGAVVFTAVSLSTIAKR